MMIQNKNGQCEDAPCCGCCGYEVEVEGDHDWATRPHEDEYEDEAQDEDGEPCGSFDGSDDAEALASAGFGTDEDYGCFNGGEDSFLDSYYESQTECDYGE